MAVSDRELNALLGFYNGLRKVVFVAGIVVMVGAVLGLVWAAFMLGRQNGLHNGGAIADGGTVHVQPQEKPQPEKRAAPHRVQRGRITPPLPEPVIEETEAEPREEVTPVSRLAGAVTEMPVPASPVVVLSPDPGSVPDFTVTVNPKKHRWPRRFFGTIGRGLGKVIGVR